MRAIRVLACPGCEPLPNPEPAVQTAEPPLVSRHLCERAMRAKAALEGERKQVTVLFADIQRVNRTY